MSTINTGQSRQTFTQDKWYAYSGIVQGDITAPATVTLIDIPNTGLKNSFVKIQGHFGLPITTGFQDALGISILIDGIEVIKQQSEWNLHYTPQENQSFELFIPRQSSLTILSLNTGANNTQDRGVTVLGWHV